MTINVCQGDRGVSGRLVSTGLHSIYTEYDSYSNIIPRSPDGQCLVSVWYVSWLGVSWCLYDRYRHKSVEVTAFVFLNNLSVKHFTSLTDVLSFPPNEKTVLQKSTFESLSVLCYDNFIVDSLRKWTIPQPQYAHFLCKQLHRESWSTEYKQQLSLIT